MVDRATSSADIHLQSGTSVGAPTRSKYLVRVRPAMTVVHVIPVPLNSSESDWPKLETKAFDAA